MTEMTEVSVPRTAAPPIAASSSVAPSTLSRRWRAIPPLVVVSLVILGVAIVLRYSLPNCRQVIPAVARSRDGLEQRTIVLAVERNTKTMEPVMREAND